MKHVHKFRLVPVDAAIANATALEEKMQEVLHDKHLPAETRGAIYEDLTAKKQNLKTETDSEVPSVQVVDVDQNRKIPKFRLPSRAANLWQTTPQLRANTADEIVLSGQTLPGTSLTRCLEYATGKSRSGTAPAGYAQIQNLLSQLQPPKTRNVRAGVSKASRAHVRKPVSHRKQKLDDTSAAADDDVSVENDKRNSGDDSDSRADHGDQDGQGRGTRERKRLYIKLWAL